MFFSGLRLSESLCNCKVSLCEDSCVHIGIAVHDYGNASKASLCSAPESFKEEFCTSAELVMDLLGGILSLQW